MTRSVRFTPVCVFALLFIALLAAPATAQRASTISGTVTDAEDGAPLEGVNVIVPALDRGTTTDAEGRFALEEVPPGTYDVEARFVGYATVTRTVEVDGETVDLELVLTPEPVNLTGIEVTALRPDVQPSGKLASQQIREAEVADPGALLRDLPGVGAVRRGPMGLDPNVRGLSETEVGVYIGGMRTFPAGPARMDSPMSHIDPSTIKNINVVKGPYALTWGPGNMSAVQVEQRGEDPPRTPLTGSVRTGFDTNRNAVETTGFAMGRQGRWFYSANGAWRTGDDYEAGNGQTVPADFTSGEGRGRIGVELSPHSTLSLTGSYQDQRNIDYPGRLLNAEFFETGMGQLKYEYSSGTGTLRALNVRASAQQTLHGMSNEGKPTFEAGRDEEGTVVRPPLRIHVDSEIQNFGGRVAADLALRAWDLTVGGDVIHTFRDATRPLEAVMPDGSRVVPPFFRTETDTLDRAWPGVTITQEGVFAKASRGLGERVTLTASTRLDFAQSDANDPTRPFLENAGVTEDELDQSDVMPSGSVTASLALTDRWTLSLGGGTVARPPNALERYSDRFPASKSQTSAEFQGIPSLDPERSTQGDLWIEGAGRTWSLSINAFARHIDDYITLAPAADIDPILPLSPETVFRYINGEANFYGTEVDASVAFAESWTGRVSGSWLRGDDEALDEPAFGVLPPSATLGLRWTPSLPLRRVSNVYVDAAADLVAEQDRAAISRGEEATDGYTTVDLRMGADLIGRTSLEVGIKNLFNSEHTNHLNAKNPFTGEQVPEPGRVVTATLTVQF